MELAEQRTDRPEALIQGSSAIRNPLENKGSLILAPFLHAADCRDSRSRPAARVPGRQNDAHAANFAVLADAISDSCILNELKAITFQ